MKKRYSNWWFLTLNGIIAILFGVLILFFTPAIIIKLVLFFGILVLLSGMGMLANGVVKINSGKRATLLVFESIATIAIGAIIMFFPQNSLQFFLLVVGVWAVILGVIQLILVANVKIASGGKNLFLLNGLLTLVIGIALFFNPFAMAEFVVKLIGIFSLIFGCLLIYLSFILKNVVVAAEK